VIPDKGVRKSDPDEASHLCRWMKPRRSLVAADGAHRLMPLNVMEGAIWLIMVGSGGSYLSVTVMADTGRQQKRGNAEMESGNIAV